MIQSPTERLEDKIVKALATQSTLTTIQIQQKLETTGTLATLQGIYRILSKLIECGVVIKDKQSFSLRIPWIFDLAHMVNQMEETYLHEKYIWSILPKSQSQRRVWHFSDLQKANNFWSQLLLTMAYHEQQHIYLHCSAHLWMNLLHRTQEEQFLHSLFKHIKRSYVIITNKTFLDKLYTPYTTSDSCKENIYLATQEEDKLIHDSTQHIDVIGEYVLHTYLSKDLALAIENIYSDITNIKKFDEIAVQKKLASLRGSIKMTLKKAPVVSTRYYKRFERIFGPLY